MLQYVTTQIFSKLLRFIPLETKIHILDHISTKYDLWELKRENLFLFVSPNVLTTLINRTNLNILCYIMKESFYSPFFMIKHNIFESVWNLYKFYSSNSSQTNPVYLSRIGFEWIFGGLNDCPSAIELHLMILMFEGGYFGPLLHRYFADEFCPDFRPLAKIISRLVQYQYGHCNCSTNNCIYNAEQPFALLPEEQKDKYRQLCQYDLIDESSQILYPSTVSPNDNFTISLDDLINFTPTFGALVGHIIDFIENYHIINRLQSKIHRFIPKLSANYHIWFQNLLFDSLDYCSDKCAIQLCYRLESIYFQYHGCSINYMSKSSMDELKQFILDTRKNKSGITIQKSVILTIHQCFIDNRSQ
jgi:hypothetical protein